MSIGSDLLRAGFRMRRLLRVVSALLVAGSLFAGGCSLRQPLGGFDEIVLDAEGPHDPWGKAAGDIDGDGVQDIVIGGHKGRPPSLWTRLLNRIGLASNAWSPYGMLVWYSGADHRRHLISEKHNIRTDIEVVDVDGDGRNDIVAVAQQGLVWFRAPDWTPTVIDDRILHDVEVADLDGDGRLDMVARNQHLFGRKDGDWIHFYRQTAPLQWQHAGRRIAATPNFDSGGEGLEVADVDGDRRPDVLINQAYLRNPGPWQDPGSWEVVGYCPDWKWPHAYLDVVDLNGDGRPDVVMAPAEPAGAEYRLSWCEAPAQAGGAWVEHVIDAKVEAAMHGVGAGDLDGDGRMGVVAATMHVAQGPKEIAVYRPQPNGAWSRSVIGRSGSHSIKLADTDRDGDLDVIGANYTGDDEGVRLWVNQAAVRTASGWRRHVVDADLPWPSVFVLAADLDGDGQLDIASGSRWYRNPGRAEGRWSAHTIGPGAHNVALAHDFDRDGHADLLVSEWNGQADWSWKGRIRRALRLQVDGRPGALLFARNDGRGSFEVLDRIEPGQGDFLQGIALLRAPTQDRVVLSWHREGTALQQVLVPKDPRSERWAVGPLWPQSQNEELSATDLDLDGVPDLVQGSQWLRQSPTGTWTAHPLRQPLGTPDRHRIGDIDGNGRPDVVVGDQAISRPGRVAWYGAPGDPTQTWTEHPVGSFTGPMSLGLADMDGDGDLDVIVGEHDLRHPASARLLWLENRTGGALPWLAHLIHTGDEHHDGALAIDIDRDGDIDVVSIGWGHRRLHLYENLSRRPT